MSSDVLPVNVTKNILTRIRFFWTRIIGTGEMSQHRKALFTQACHEFDPWAPLKGGEENQVHSYPHIRHSHVHTHTKQKQRNKMNRKWITFLELLCQNGDEMGILGKITFTDHASYAQAYPPAHPSIKSVASLMLIPRVLTPRLLWLLSWMLGKLCFSNWMHRLKEYSLSKFQQK